MISKKNILIAQGGGPTNVINMSLVSIIEFVDFKKTIDKNEADISDQKDEVQSGDDKKK